MNDIVQFQRDCAEEIARMGQDDQLRGAAGALRDLANAQKYSYHFSWMGLPIIQYPQDIIALQEIIWQVKPEVIVETGVARGGSLVFYASMLQLLGGGAVVGIDIDIRPHNREAITSHPLAESITLVDGSSTAPEVVEQVRAIARGRRTLVVLDSNHTHEHVYEELKAYADLIPVGGYLVVMDTVIEDLPDDAFPDRPWSRKDNPKTAVRAFLAERDDFVSDTAIDAKLLLTVAPEGYLKRIR